MIKVVRFRVLTRGILIELKNYLDLMQWSWEELFVCDIQVLGQSQSENIAYDDSPVQLVKGLVIAWDKFSRIQESNFSN